MGGECREHGVAGPLTAYRFGHLQGNVTLGGCEVGDQRSDSMRPKTLIADRGCGLHSFRELRLLEVPPQSGKRFRPGPLIIDRYCRLQGISQCANTLNGIKVRG